MVMDAGVPVLETVRLVLRAHRIDDFEAVAALWGDPAVVRFMAGGPENREQSWARLLRIVGHWRLLGFGYWVVEAKQDGRFLGHVGFADYRRDMTPPLRDWPEAGWVFNVAEAGQGYATEAVGRMHLWADDHFGDGATVCIVDPEHQASIRIATKVGYGVYAGGTYMERPMLVMARPVRGLRDIAPC